MLANTILLQADEYTYRADTDSAKDGIRMRKLTFTERFWCGGS